jgi:bifunctional non-homologous end joining protein LigD
VPWARTVGAARQLRDVLAVLGLQSWVKTTGGAGLHVVAPLQPRRAWEECLAFARAIAQLLERGQRDLYTTAYATRGREARILIDYLRNNRTNTTIAAYSTRARAGAPVSVPLTWRELGARRPAFTITGTLRRLARLRADPWKDYWRCRQQLSSRIIAAVAAA